MFTARRELDAGSVATGRLPAAATCARDGDRSPPGLGAEHESPGPERHRPQSPEEACGSQHQAAGCLPVAGCRSEPPLVDVLQRGGEHPAKRVNELTPRVWKTVFADQPLRSVLGRTRDPP